MGYSVSVSRDKKIAPKHDRRDYVPRNVEQSLMGRNVVFKDCPDVAAAFNDFFRGSIQRYNDRQTRANRKKSEDYYNALLTGAEGYGKGDTQEKPVYEYVLQIGNKDDNGVTDDQFDGKHWQALKDAGKLDEAAEYTAKHLNIDPDREALKDVLNTVGGKLEERYPNFHILYSYGHDDEPCGTYQLHVAFVPYVTGQKTGLDTRVSLRKALQGMGFTGNPKEGIKAWQRDVKALIEEEMDARGFEREYMGNNEAHLDVDTFKIMEENKRLQAERDRLAGEVVSLKRQKTLLGASVRNLQADRQAVEDWAAGYHEAPVKAPDASEMDVIECMKRTPSKKKDGTPNPDRTMYDVWKDRAQREKQRQIEQQQTERMAMAIRIQQDARKDPLKERQDSQAASPSRRSPQTSGATSRRERPVPDLSNIDWSKSSGYDYDY